VLYTAKDGTGHGKIEDGKVQGGLFSYDAKTGRARPFPNGQGKMPVTNWDEKLAAGKHHAANLVALAASPDRLFASLHLENKIVALDKKTFQVAETYNVTAPLGLAYKAASKVLYAVSGNNVVAIDIANGGKVSPFISTGLDHPRKLAFDGAGNLYVSTRGAQMQVRVFSPQGKYLRAVGKAGGRPAVGKFDPNGVYMPNGLSVDARGQLWVTESDETPKRISLWNAGSGAYVKDFYGSTAYAPMMAPDLDNPEQVYLHNTRWIVNYETGAWSRMPRCIAKAIWAAKCRRAPKRFSVSWARLSRWRPSTAASMPTTATAWFTRWKATA
jgi:DNA-binding beta-propeller fold protein YncE